MCNHQQKLNISIKSDTAIIFSIPLKPKLLKGFQVSGEGIPQIGIIFYPPAV